MQWGEGVLTITTGTTSVDVTVTAENDNLTGLAKAINDANAGVTATVVTDSNGARLMVKGKTGAANAFTLSVPGGTTSGLERFASASMTTPLAAQDAEVWLDQLALELREAAPGSGARADLAHRILSDPRLSLGAQANVDAAALRSLKD